MTTFALAHIKQSTFNDGLIEYLGRIDATLAPYGGQFRIHAGAIMPLEGAWAGQVVLIEFLDHNSAQDWYDSAAYQAILGLRTANSTADVILIDGVPPGHKATDLLSAAAHDTTAAPTKAGS